jgi:cytidine deaminase
MDKNRLFEEAKKVSQKAYARYSDFPVGACLLTTEGELFIGVNVENASHPCGQCAEASAIGNMVSARGPSSKIKAIAVVANVEEGVLPCGNCLQRISEFAVSGRTLILSGNSEGIQREFWLDDLMPYRFKSV